MALKYVDSAGRLRPRTDSAPDAESAHEPRPFKDPLGKMLLGQPRQWRELDPVRETNG